MNVEPPVIAKPPFWKRPLRLAFTIFTLLAIFLILAPYGVVALLQRRASEDLSDALGVPCRVDALRFGWMSGVAVEGIEIANAPGFDVSRPALRMQSARADIGLLRMFSGEFGIVADVRGLEVCVEENDRGETNLETLLRNAGIDTDEALVIDVDTNDDTSKPSGERPSRRGNDRDKVELLGKLSLHLALTNGSFELRRAGQLVERIEKCDAVIEKTPGSTELVLSLSTTLPSLREGQPSGELSADLRVDADTEAGFATLRANHFDIGRYRALLDATLAQGSVTQLAGVVDGVIEARFHGGARNAESKGEITLTGLRAAGSLFSGFDVSVGRCTLRPGVASDRVPLADAPMQPHELLVASNLDFGFEATDVAIARDDAPIESFAKVKFAVSKSKNAPRLRAVIELDGAAERAGKKPHLLCTAESDTTTKFTRGVLQIEDMDLAAYRRFLDGAVSREELSRCEGELSGRIDFETDFGSARRVDVNGEIAIDAPVFAGSLLQGVDLRSERFSLRPSVRALLPDIDGTNRIDLGKTSLDLGFASVQSLDAEARAQRGIAEGGACAFTADLAKLATLGGPFASLRGTTGTTSGLIRLPKALLEGDVQRGLETLRDVRNITADANVTGLSWSHKGLSVADAVATASFQDGVLTATTSDTTRLNAGPLRLTLRADSKAPQMPFELTFAWKGGAVEGEAAELLRYLVPLLAGTTGKAADFRSVCDLDMSLAGFALRQQDENALQWLDRWTGSGSITLTNGRVVPAQALQPLLSLLGQPQELAIDRLGSTFTLQQGAITHRAMKWVSKGEDYGLAGKVRLDGGMELALDVTQLLQRHKDGKAIAGFLGNTPLTANLTGTVDAPKFAAPDLGKLLQQALQAAPRQLLEQQGQELLQKGFEKLFGDKKKKDEPTKKQ